MFEAWVQDISDAGATITAPEGIALPAIFAVYFDAGLQVGRTVSVESRLESSCRVIFTGKASRP